MHAYYVFRSLTEGWQEVKDVGWLVGVFDGERGEEEERGWDCGIVGLWDSYLTDAMSLTFKPEVLLAMTACFGSTASNS